MLSANASPHFLQGPETFPADPTLAYLRNLAKNGAAIVTFADWANPNQRLKGAADSLRMQSFDLTDPSVSNYFSQLAADVHFYGSKMCLSARLAFPEGYVFSEQPKPDVQELTQLGFDASNPVMKNMLDMLGGDRGQELPQEKFPEVFELFVEKLRYFQDCGYDMVSIGVGMYLSPFGNRRKDNYGGSLENRARFPLELCRRIKAALGQDFLIEAVLAGEEEEGGYTLAETIAFAKMAEGLINIFQLRESDGAKGHPTGFNSRPGQHETIRYAEAIKKSGAKVFVEPIGGFQDLAENEAYIASGKADLIGMARAFICDPEYAKKAYEGRGEDVVPCIRCNKCHGVMKGPWINFCSVNPTMGIAHKLERMVEAPVDVKTVAVIGGGPAGLEAAIVAAQRGHQVTLYEKSQILGGQLIHSEYSSFKWPLKNFKDYLIGQLKKLAVDVRIGTEAIPGLIKAGGYDAVITATGAKPNYPDIPGIHASKVLTCLDVYGREQELGANVVIVGGSELGTETGMYLAEKGHNVTILTRKAALAHDSSPLHYITMAGEKQLPGGMPLFIPAWANYANLRGITGVTTTKIEEQKVTYVDAGGNEQTIDADSVVISGGMNALQDEALRFYDTAGRFFMVGDCNSVGNVQKCMREAFAAAAQI